MIALHYAASFAADAAQCSAHEKTDMVAMLNATSAATVAQCSAFARACKVAVCDDALFAANTAHCPTFVEAGKVAMHVAAGSASTFHGHAFERIMHDCRE